MSGEVGIRSMLIYIELGSAESTTSARLAWGSWGPRIWMIAIWILHFFDYTLRLEIQKLKRHVRKHILIGADLCKSVDKTLSE